MSECLASKWEAMFLTYDLHQDVYDCTTEELLKIQGMNWCKCPIDNDVGRIVLFGNGLSDINKILRKMGRKEI